MLHLAWKAFRPGRIPFPVMQVDTGHNFPEVQRYRDAMAERYGAELIVASVQESIDSGRVADPGPLGSRNRLQSVTLLDALKRHGFDAAFGGGRRDEDKARAKERILSFRDLHGQWEPRAQRPEPWNVLNARIAKGEHLRAFPLSNWTELDIWQYIAREAIELPSIYYSHRRPVVRRRGLLVPVTPLTPPGAGETVEEIAVRFRTVGDVICTCPVESTAASVAEIVQETVSATLTERGATRMDDQTSEASMERRKKEGYF